MERYEVWCTVGGARESSDDYSDADTAEGAAKRLANMLRAEVPAGEDWAVYILPHYCDASDPDTECDCVQWLQDHHPVHSSVPA